MGSSVRRHSSRRPLFEGLEIVRLAELSRTLSVHDRDRLHLQPALGVLLLLLTGCTYKAPPEDIYHLTAHPGVSAPVLQSARVKIMASKATVAFNCQAYARTLIPWKGTDYTNPAFSAANEAILPDAPEFTDRRRAGCATLEKAANGTSTSQ